MFDFKRRRHFNALVEEAASKGNPGPLTEFVRSAPGWDEKVEAIARARHTHNASGEALALTVALAMADSPRAAAPLTELIEHSNDPHLSKAWPIRWDSVSGERLALLCAYLRQRGFDELANDFLRCLPAPQSAHALGEYWQHWFQRNLRIYLDAPHPAEPIAEIVATQVERSALSGQLSRVMAEAALGVAEAIWRGGKNGPALDILMTVSLASPSDIVPGWLGELASRLSKCEGLALVRAVNILRRYPSADWMPYLKEAWVNVEEKIRELSDRAGAEPIPRPQRSTQRDDMALEHAAAALATAIGVCAACDSESLTPEESDQGLEELHPLIDERNRCVDEHLSLQRDYHLIPATDSDRQKRAEMRIIETRLKIERMDEQIRVKRRTLRARMSGSHLLLLTLQDEQAYPASVRQAAAWGLWKLIEVGAVNEELRRKILAMIDRSTFDRDRSGLLEEIAGLGLEEELTAEVSEAATNYLEIPNWVTLISRLRELGLDHDSCERVSAVIRAFTGKSSPSHHFQERVIHFVGGQRFLELEQAVLDAIVWMLDLIESRRADGLDEFEDEWDFRELRGILKHVLDYIPKPLDFLGKYPLRLMTSEQHARILGKFARTKADISLWTRYTPPLWKRGAPPDQIGQVRRRYLQLDDRSAPNAMGISWRLLGHPVLAVPVLYHEFMHYGGPDGDPARGIANETEVHLRELIFTRGLIARMAPDEENDIPEYERRLIRGAQNGEGADRICRLLLLDFTKDENLNWLNAHIEGIYGHQLSDGEAREQVNNSMEYENIEIQLANRTNEMKLNWQPEIEWPYLNSGQTSALTRTYSEIMQRSLTTDHSLHRAACNRVLQDPALRKYQDDWISYTQRPNALQEFWESINGSEGDSE